MGAINTLIVPPERGKHRFPYMAFIESMPSQKDLWVVDQQVGCPFLHS